jgi:MoaA/NifB/PqqE/SkfB family radical SAM enzyme
MGQNNKCLPYLAFGWLNLLLPMTPFLAFRRAAIETVSHCNHRCVYCPVSVDPPAKGVMTDAVFHKVLARLFDYQPFWERISLNHYGEPTLDPNLVPRIRLCLERTGQVLINTNGGLSLSSHFAKLGEVPMGSRQCVTWNINLPTTNYERYGQLHGVPGTVLNVIQNNIARLRALGYPVMINLQLNRFTDRAQTTKLANAFEVQVNICRSTSRAGSIEVGAQVEVDPRRLAGCSWKRPYEVVHVGIHGEVFLCCEDFKKSVQFGSLLEHSLTELMESDTATKAFAKLHGLLKPEAGFPCLKCQYAIQK